MSATSTTGKPGRPAKGEDNRQILNLRLAPDVIQSLKLIAMSRGARPNEVVTALVQAELPKAKAAIAKLVG